MKSVFVQNPRQAAAARPARCARRPVRVAAAVNVEQLKAAKQELYSYINSRGCNPITLRLGWHDAGTYDKNVKEWPKCGGANGSIRFKPEIGHAANKGLEIALAILAPMKKKYPDVSYADLFQMASAVAVEAAGGPKIPMRYGRKDAQGPEDCIPGRKPARMGWAREPGISGWRRGEHDRRDSANQHSLLETAAYTQLGTGASHPFADGSASPADHLRKVFYRMGLDDKDIVALSGGHTLGRARPERSGYGEVKTKYTDVGPGLTSANSNRTDRPTTPKPVGQLGASWTVNWLDFDNSYFTEIKAKRDADLLVLETDACIFEDDKFRPYAEMYAADQDAFFADYATSHVKLSELGVEWEEGGPVTGI